MSCKLTHMLLSYHFLALRPNIIITGVSGFTGINNEVTHYWIEIKTLSLI